MSERSYWPHLCLVQVSWAKGVALVDPLGVRRARARNRAARAGHDDHARGRERPAHPRPRHRRARRRRCSTCSSRPASSGSACPRSARWCRCCSGSGSTSRSSSPTGRAPAVRRHPPLRRGRRRAPLPAHDRAAAPAAGHGRETWAASECEVLRTTADRRVDPDGGVVEDQGRVVDARRRRRASRSRWPGWRERVRNGSTCCPGSCCPISRSPRLSAVRRRRSRPAVRVCAASTACPTTWCASCSPRSRLGARCPRTGCVSPRSTTTVPSSTPRSRCSWRTSPSSRCRAQSRSSCWRPRDDVKALVYGRPSRLDAGWRAQIAGDQLHRLLDGQAVIRLTDRGRHLRLED